MSSPTVYYNVEKKFCLLCEVQFVSSNMYKGSEQTMQFLDV